MEEVKLAGNEIQIRPFHPDDQLIVKQIILAGLADHWGELDLSLNTDLNDIVSSYRGETFLVALQGKTIVGCGALVEEVGKVGYGRIVRMSVRKENRRQGVGQHILHHLQLAAKQRKFEKLVLETTQTWHEVVAFYQADGFQIIGHQDGDTHFEKAI